MSTKFYQVDYAQMIGFEIKSMGILNIQTDKGITRELLREQVRQHVNDPEANIVISHIAKLNRGEFELFTTKKA